MTRVFLFGDESGTMPANDGDEPFCVATIATSEKPPAIVNRSGKIQALVEIFRQIRCVPHVVFVRPTRGYGELLRRKTSKMNTMARATRLRTRSHEYFSDRGYNPRDMIWIRCMAVSLVRAVVRRARAGPIRAVSLILDSKSMAEGSRRLFVDRVCSMAEDIRGPRANVQQGNQPSLDTREHIQFGRDDVSVFWSDEMPSPDFEDGLFLAHRLSGLAKTALETATEAELAEDLSMEFTDLFYDATLDVMRPLPRAAVQRWKNQTGLPEPVE